MEDYKILSAKKIENLEREVKVHLKQGWLISGNVSIVLGDKSYGEYSFIATSQYTSYNARSTFLQTMYKPKEVIKEEGKTYV